MTRKPRPDCPATFDNLTTKRENYAVQLRKKKNADIIASKRRNNRGQHADFNIIGDSTFPKELPWLRQMSA